ncbi:MAG: choice-of-anchor J domain-containing protein [candidate division WOR-3 bacterium]
MTVMVLVLGAILGSFQAKINGKELNKSVTDTLNYAGDPTYYYANTQYLYKYWWTSFNIKDFRPNYNSQDSVLYLTQFQIYLYNSQAGQVCTLIVKNGSDMEIYRTTFATVGGTAWNVVSLPNVMVEGDSFRIVLYVNTRRTGNKYRQLPYWDSGAPVYRRSGWWTSSGGYVVNSERDLCMQVIGIFEARSVVPKDLGVTGVCYPTVFKVGERQEVLRFGVQNYYDADEVNVPLTMYFNGDTQTVVIPLCAANSCTKVDFPNFSYTPDREGLFDDLWAYVILDGDLNPFNDTLKGYSLYRFPKYTYYATEFELADTTINSWTIVDGDNDGESWIYSSNYSIYHSGRGVAISPNATDGNSDDWLFTPAFPVDSGYNSSFGFYARTQSLGRSEKLEVWVCGTPNPASTIEKVIDENITSNWTRFTIPLDKYTGQTIYMGFRKYTSSDQDFILLDNAFFRKVPLQLNKLLIEEFEEGMVPPGWSVDAILWSGGTPEEAGVPNNETGNVFYFTSSAPSGTSSELISPPIRLNPGSGYEVKISCQFDYCNIDGQDSLVVYYRLGLTGDWQRFSSLSASGRWVPYSSEYLQISGDSKSTVYLQFKLVGYADEGATNIAIDNFTVNLIEIMGVSVEKEGGVRISGKSRAIVVNIPVGMSGAFATVFDPSGRIIRKFSLDKPGRYEISGLKPGVYLIRITGAVEGVRKVVVR